MIGRARNIVVADDVDRRVRCLLAVVGGARSVRAVAAEAGINVSTAYTHLSTLRAAGLVAWEPGRRGTLRPLVGVATR